MTEATGFMNERQKNGSPDGRVMKVASSMSDRRWAMKPIVLIIEDNPLTRAMLQLTLTSEGLEVLGASDGAEALKVLDHTVPDLILQDLLLPDMDGFDLVARLRAHRNTAGTPIIAFSGFLSGLHYGKAAAAGFVDFLPKPVDPSHLVQVVRAYLPSQDVQNGHLGQGRRLLVVDDDAVQLKLARVLLTGLDFHVSTAPNGISALEVLRSEPIDAVLSDVLMPEVDGFSLCAQMNEDPDLRGIPVVLVTNNYLEEADRQLAVRMGARSFVLRTPDLGGAVRAVLRALGNPESSLSKPSTKDAAVHQERIKCQLERQAAINLAHAYRSSMHAASLSVLAEVSEALIKSQDIVSVLPSVLESLLEASGVSRGAIYLCREKDGVLTLATATGYSEDSCVALRQFCGQPGPFEQATKLLTPLLLIPRPAKDSEDEPCSARSEFALLVPLVADQECLGLLYLASKTRDLIENNWLPFARTMSVQIGQSLALSRAFSRLRASEARYRGVVKTAGEGIYTLDSERRILDMNPAMERILQCSPGELIGTSILDVVAPEDQISSDLSYQRLAKVRHVRSVARRFLRADGQVVICDVSATMTEVEGETVAVGVVRDVTEAHRSAAELQLLQTLTLAASEAADLDSAFQIVLRMICETTGWCYGAAWLPKGNDLQCANWWTLDIELKNRLLPLTQPRFACGDGTLGQVWASREPLWVDSLSVLSDRRRDTAVACGIRGGLAVPVVAEDQVIAVLEFLYTSGGEDERRVQLVSTSAHQLASVIARQRAEDALEHTQEQLRQSQKMEAVGRLAGGVAHDFNNLLSVILSYSEMGLLELAPSDPMRSDLEEILKAGQRAAELTRQLLIFSRQQVLTLKVFDLNVVVTAMGKMLQRMLGADIAMVSSPASDLGHIKVDPGSMEQVIMNLVVNARDAMPRGGRLTLTTANVYLIEEGTLQDLRKLTGPHVMLAVTDTGVGMDHETQLRIFEPFFTTKDVGKGTGLGLSTVFGSVQSSGGAICVESEKGVGTTFKLYLPRVDALLESVSEPKTRVTQHGSETILLVEDQDQVRTVSANILRKYGYNVIEAAGPGQALLLSEQTEDEIQLLLTDVVMPQMSGPELSVRLKALRPKMRVLCMSGYTDYTAFRHGVMEAQLAYLQKPVTPDKLTSKVREVLDTPQ